MKTTIGLALITESREGGEPLWLAESLLLPAIRSVGSSRKSALAGLRRDLRQYRSALERRGRGRISCELVDLEDDDA